MIHMYMCGRTLLLHGGHINHIHRSIVNVFMGRGINVHRLLEIEKKQLLLIAVLTRKKDVS